MGDRPAPIETEIEVTPQMIDAGEDALASTLGGAVTEIIWYPRDLAVEVYRAMERCR